MFIKACICALICGAAISMILLCIIYALEHREKGDLNSLNAFACAILLMISSVCLGAAIFVYVETVLSILQS